MSRNRDIANVLSKSTALATDTELLTAGGLVYVGGTTFSAASTVSLDNVFSSTYDNYKLKIDITTSTAAYIHIKLRAGGTDKSANYGWTGAYINNNTTSWSWINSPNDWSSTAGIILGVNNSGPKAEMEIFNPFKTSKTDFHVFENSTFSGNNYNYSAHVGGRHNEDYSATSLTAYSTAGTMTGIIRVYGYRNDNN